MLTAQRLQELPLLLVGLCAVAAWLSDPELDVSNQGITVHWKPPARSLLLFPLSQSRDCNGRSAQASCQMTYGHPAYYIRYTHSNTDSIIY